MEITTERMAQMQAANESMFEKVDVSINEDNTVSISVYGRLTQDEMGALICRLTELDCRMDDEP